MEALVILLAFIAGLLFKRLGYPPLPGYLLAGFAAHALGLGDAGLISAIADIGVLLLLFVIGLKLDLRDIAAPHIWGVASLHALIVIPLTAAVIIVVSPLVFADEGLDSVSSVSVWTLAFALSFSSTVFAVKIFEDRGENAAFHARIAIGILVLQDLLAVGYLVFSSDQRPDISAVLLLLLIGARPVLLQLMRLARHGELLLLFGVTAALGAAELFEFFELKGSLGALFAGVLLSNADKTKELYRSLLGLKDLLLIGFFLQIGYYGLPDTGMLIVALALGALVGLRPLVYYGLMVAFKLRARTSLLAGASLFTYSEFGLVVAAVAVAAGDLSAVWLTTIALALSISFFIATPVNMRVHDLYSRFAERLQKFERPDRIRDEQPADMGDADVAVLGMGRVGKGAYERLRELYGDSIVGVEESYDKMLELQEEGLNCVHGDAIDHDFWAHSGLLGKKLVLVSLTNHDENLGVIDLARQLGFRGQLAVVSRFPDQLEELENRGCIAFNLYGEAGHGFAEHVLERMD